MDNKLYISELPNMENIPETKGGSRVSTNKFSKNNGGTYISGLPMMASLKDDNSQRTAIGSGDENKNKTSEKPKMATIKEVDPNYNRMVSTHGASSKMH